MYMNWKFYEIVEFDEAFYLCTLSAKSIEMNLKVVIDKEKLIGAF